jgi:hypothetical protein
MPFWSTNPSASSAAARPELIDTVAPARVVVSGELTVRVAVTGTGAVPASYGSVVDSIFASSGGLWRVMLMALVAVLESTVPSLTVNPTVRDGEGLTFGPLV